MFAFGSKAKAPRILLVEDNAASAQTLAMLMEMSGYAVTVAEDGMTALELYKKVEPMIVLIDIGLPDIDGHEVAKRMRAISGAATPILVAVTGWGREDMHPAGGECVEFDFYLTKPVNYDDLEKLLQRTGISGGAEAHPP